MTSRSTARPMCLALLGRGLPSLCASPLSVSGASGRGCERVGWVKQWYGDECSVHGV